MLLTIGDYIEGFENYGTKVQKIRGWVDKVRKDSDGLLIVEIQCDDRWCGFRSNYIYEKLGKITIIDKQKPRPSFIVSD